VILLGFDSATLTISVAVTRDGEVLFADDAGAAPSSEVLLPLVDRGLAAAGLRPAELGGIACGAGPGSFTGLRIGVATAKGLALALGVPLYLPSSLAALAFGVDASRPVLAMLDARRQEVFAGLFAPDGTALADEVVGPPEVVLALAGDTRPVIVGDGAAAYPEIAARAGEVRLDVRRTPSGVAVCRLARAPVDLSSAAPAYLRGADAIAKPPRPPFSRRR
jgi:tRNA threonylcarbamoyladenosine biosynthesis protein TsaB